MIRILLISDIHANYPALQAIENYFNFDDFNYLINCGDSVVYGPFPNETIAWLSNNSFISILGNTDKKVIKLLKGKTFRKPSNPEKRVMYTWTAEQLENPAQKYLLSLKKKLSLSLSKQKGKAFPSIGIYHGSPDKPHEFLFNTTTEERFVELASNCPHRIIVFGHSHDPFHKIIGKHHFINPGSSGRMFDGNPEPSCATLQIEKDKLLVNHFRIPYNIEATVRELQRASLPMIYQEMYRIGRKIN